MNLYTNSHPNGASRRRPLTPTQISSRVGMALRLAAQERAAAAQAERIAAQQVVIDRLTAELKELRKTVAERTRRMVECEALLQVHRNRISLADLLQIVADVSAVSPAELQGPRRTRICARPRQMYCWLAKRYAPQASMPVIGRTLGNRDHTTVLHAIRTINRLIEKGDFEVITLRDDCLARVEALIAERAAAP